jgi:prophage regulatory protein
VNPRQKPKPKPERFLRRWEVMERVGVTHSQIDNMEREGIFPRRIKISTKCAGWLESEVDAFIRQRVALSRGRSRAA